MKLRLIRLLRRLSLGVSFLGLLATFLMVILWDAMVHTIPPGHAGVLWHRISLFEGPSSRGPLQEGIHVILPWDKIYFYDMRLQHLKQHFDVLSNDGLNFGIDIDFRWKLMPEKLLVLNRTVGPDYVEKLVVQEIGSVTHEITARYSAEALFTTARGEVQKAMYDKITKGAIWDGTHLGKNAATDVDSEYFDMIYLVDILINKVYLPKRFSDAIDSKLEQAQVVEEYKYRVAREALESERKRVEAEGIRNFQEIVTPAISESYLRWRGIEATLKLAQSPNSKVVVIGNSATGLPLILDTTTSRAVDGSTSAIKGNAPSTSLDEYSRNDQVILEELNPKMARKITDASNSAVSSAPPESSAGELESSGGN